MYQPISRFVLLMALCGAVRGMAQSPDFTRAEQIPTAPGPEDLLLDTSTGSPRLIISCGDFARVDKDGRASSQLWYYDIAAGRSGAFDVMPIDSIPKLFPHGISMHPKKNELYVIAHTEDERKSYVIVYSIEGTRLVPVQVVADPRYLGTPNDLAVDDDGGFYVTNNGSFKWWSLPLRLIGISSSSVSYYDRKSGTFQFVTRRVSGANGVHVRGTALFVSDSFKRKVKRLELDNHVPRQVRKSTIGFGGDNFSESDGTIYLARHKKGGKLKKPVKDPSYRIPFVIYRVDAATGNAEELTSHQGEKISCVSVGVVHDGYLYLGQIYQPYVLKVKL